jgi:hypothetical protein
LSPFLELLGKPYPYFIGCGTLSFRTGRADGLSASLRDIVLPDMEGKRGHENRVQEENEDRRHDFRPALRRAVPKLLLTEKWPG